MSESSAQATSRAAAPSSSRLIIAAYLSENARSADEISGYFEDSINLIVSGRSSGAYSTRPNNLQHPF